ncbi:MAG: carboxymuconolactone decarboxylase family protein [Planctomycetota bacterium]
MTLDALKQRLPEDAKDVRVNLSAIAQVESLSAPQLWGATWASALATGQPEVMRAFAVAAQEHLEESGRSAVRRAAETMAMNNVYYRSLHLLSNREYDALPARLRMQALAKPGVPALDFEIWSLAVSAINGCGRCLDAHEKQIRKNGGTAQQVQDVIRIASIVNAVAATLEMDRELTSAVERPSGDSGGRSAHRAPAGHTVEKRSEPEQVPFAGLGARSRAQCS